MKHKFFTPPPCCPVCLSSASPPPPLSLPPKVTKKWLSFSFSSPKYFSSLLLLCWHVFSSFAPPERTSLLSFFFSFFTMGPRLQDCHTHKGLASLVLGCGGEKKRSWRRVLLVHWKLLHYISQDMGANKGIQALKTHTFSATNIGTSSNNKRMKSWQTGSRQLFLWLCIVWRLSRAPTSLQDALFLMVNTFKRVFPFFPFAQMNGLLLCEKSEIDFSPWVCRGTTPTLACQAGQC